MHWEKCKFSFAGTGNGLFKSGSSVPELHDLHGLFPGLSKNGRVLNFGLILRVSVAVMSTGGILGLKFSEARVVLLRVTC